ncbi:MAG: VPLPA-CTERM sorting domain-containing protein [Pseudomonadota bacterium]
MFTRLLSALAVVAMATLAPIAAKAATVDITGGLTQLKVTAPLGDLGIGAAAFGTAKFDGSTFDFPITGGQAFSDGNAFIEHDGVGVVLFAGTQAATVGNFQIDTANASILGNVNGGTAFAPLFDLGPASDMGIEVKISSTLGGALASVFSGANLPNLSGATFGFATTAPAVSEVPLPAAAWMLLAGLGGLFAMKRRRSV